MTSVKSKNLFSQSKRLPVGTNVLLARPTGKSKTWQIVDRMHEKSTQISSVTEQVTPTGGFEFVVPIIRNLSASEELAYIDTDIIFSWELVDPNNTVLFLEFFNCTDNELTEMTNDKTQTNFSASDVDLYRFKMRAAYVNISGEECYTDYTEEIEVKIVNMIFEANDTTVEIDETIGFTLETCIETIESDSIEIAWGDGSFGSYEYNIRSFSHSYPNDGKYYPSIKIQHTSNSDAAQLINAPISVLTEDGAVSNKTVQVYFISQIGAGSSIVELDNLRWSNGYLLLDLEEELSGGGASGEYAAFYCRRRTNSDLDYYDCGIKKYAELCFLFHHLTYNSNRHLAIFGTTWEQLNTRDWENSKYRWYSGSAEDYGYDAYSSYDPNVAGGYVYVYPSRKFGEDPFYAYSNWAADEMGDNKFELHSVGTSHMPGRLWMSNVTSSPEQVGERTYKMHLYGIDHIEAKCSGSNGRVRATLTIVSFD